ncbi:UbiA family prenyltransferase [Humisphaera borealis]|uniref:UbiA family prenyltransferase n=1 Tax=Humisphaera borealis TaxID=2807512 RepID=A0A7M2WV55_9BACT|nr:UbiA family prenyltransferase [Humisphaera borealis]QOV88370.1 UbiA family prenyltransferase [Humisphaera borealis]
MQQSVNQRQPASLPVAALRALRPHQWVKNVLLLLPLLLAHVLPWHGHTALRQWFAAVGGFTAFCLAASAIYLINDLKDLEVDRLHPTKRQRPFASGALSTRIGPPLICALLAVAAALCAALPWHFGASLAVYVTLGVAYSVWFKQRLLLDVFVLAGLYTLRLLAGGYAGSVEVSKWLLAFSIFFFVSLAFAKRYAELVLLSGVGQTEARGRSYDTGDLRLVESAGLASGYLAVLVMALYINDTSSAASKLYTAPVFLWMLCPLLMYWITRVWFVAGRKALDDDPILFAIKDRVSWCTLVMAIAIVIAAWQPWHT